MAKGFNEATDQASSHSGGTVLGQIGSTFKSGWNWLTGRDVAEEQLNYQKWYDANRYQLTAEDMANAGLSKTLSAGSSPNSSVSGNGAPSNISGITSILTALTSMKGAMSNIALQKQQAIKLQNENDYYATHGFFPGSEAGKWQSLADMGKNWLGSLDDFVKKYPNNILTNGVNIKLPNLFGSKDGVVNNSKDAQDTIIDEAKNVITSQLGSETHGGTSFSFHPVDRKTKGYNGKSKVFKYDGKDKPIYQMGGR